MKLLYKLFAVLFVFAAVNTNAQQLTTPMDLRVSAPANIASSFNYGYQSDWGPVTLLETISGSLVWGFDGTDSLGCTPITTDLTGKIALIRRGACSFSLKAYHAQEAGAIGAIILNHTYDADGGGIVNMSGGDSATLVTIPAAFLTRDDGDIILGELDNGIAVTAAFFIPVIGNVNTMYHYSTPSAQIRVLDELNITVYNNSSNPETNIVATVAITDPAGNITTLTENVATIAANTDTIVSFADYTPIDTGLYTAVYTVVADSATFNNESITQSFRISDDTYANDNGDLVGGRTNGGWDTDLRFDIGNFFYTGSDTSVVTHATFRLNNPQEMHGATFEVILYDATLPAGSATPQDYDGYTAIALGQVIIDSTMITSINDDILIELSSLQGLNNVEILPNLSYLISVQHNALSHANALALCPAYAFTSPTAYQFLNTAVYTDRFYNGGFSTGVNAYLRLYLEFGTTSSEEVKESISNAIINVFPNPTSEFVTVDVALNDLSEAVNIMIIDINGRVVANENFSNIQNDKLTFDVSNYAEGNYFVRIQTDNGFEVKQFIVVKTF